MTTLYMDTCSNMYAVVSVPLKKKKYKSWLESKRLQVEWWRAGVMNTTLKLALYVCVN